MLAVRKKTRQRWSRVTNKASEPDRRLVSLFAPASPAAEAFRMLQTNLLYGSVGEPPKVVVLTSPAPGVDKSIICANLAVALAQSGRRTILIDCDFRRPTLHSIFGTSNRKGMTDILMGERNLSQTCWWPFANLAVVTAGNVPSNLMELLGSERLAEFLAQVRQRFDHVLIDTSPVEVTSEPMILASQSDGVLLVLDAQETRKRSLQQSVRKLRAVRADVIGTVLSNV